MNVSLSETDGRESEVQPRDRQKVSVDAAGALSPPGRFTPLQFQSRLLVLVRRDCLFVKTPPKQRSCL